MKQKDKNNMWKIFAFFKLNIMLLFVRFKDIQCKIGDHVRIECKSHDFLDMML